MRSRADESSRAVKEKRKSPRLRKPVRNDVEADAVFEKNLRRREDAVEAAHRIQCLVHHGESRCWQPRSPWQPPFSRIAYTDRTRPGSAFSRSPICPLRHASHTGIMRATPNPWVTWRVYHIIFAKPIDHELVIDIDFCALNPRSTTDLDMLFLWCKEGWQKSVLGEFHTQKQALSRFFLGAMILTPAVLEVIRRELRRVSPDVKIEIEQIRNVLASEVIKREVMEGGKAEEARKKIAKAASKALRAIAKKPASGPDIIAPPGSHENSSPETEAEEEAAA